MLNSILQNLTFILSAVPLTVWLIGQATKLDALSAFRGLSDFLNICVFLGPILFYDFIGLIKINLLNTSSKPNYVADAVYIITATVVFFLIGKIISYFVQN